MRRLIRSIYLLISILIPPFLFAKPYEGYVDIRLESSSSGELSLYVETEHLMGRYVELKDLDACGSVFTDEETMRFYLTGKPFSIQEVKKLMEERWIPRYQSNQPFTAMVFFEKATDQFVLQLGIGSSKTKTLHVGYICKKEFWNQGYTTEAATAIIHYFVPLCMMKGYLLHGSPIEEICIQTREENIASQKVAYNLHMKQIDSIAKDGVKRLVFKIPVDQLKGFQV